MRVGVDMDGVLADLHPSWIELINKEFGTTYTTSDYTSWDISSLVGDSRADRARELLNTSKLYRNLPTIEYAKAGMKYLHDNGYELFIISRALFSNNPFILIDKIEWLDEHFPYLNKDNIVFTGRKDIINVDILIDDNIDHLLDNRSVRHKILYLDYHNSTDIIKDLQGDVISLPGWDAIIDYISYLSRKGEDSSLD